ncbi:unnamed protein product, partial [Meganyctiphanes norvegica]
MVKSEIQCLAVRLYDLRKHWCLHIANAANKKNGTLYSLYPRTMVISTSKLQKYDICKLLHTRVLHTVLNRNNSVFFGAFSHSLVKAGGRWGDETKYLKTNYAIYKVFTLDKRNKILIDFFYVKVAVLGSRDQMCVHPEVSKETNNNNKVHMCQMRVKAKTCYFHNQIDNKKDDSDLRGAPLDIEDLVKLGKKKSFCPYYMSRELKQDADIIFMPYNYLLDPKSRKAHSVELQGNIIIFDEAHNVEKMCEEAASLQLKSTDIALCIDEITQVMKKVQEISEGATGSEFGTNDPSNALPEDFSPEDLYTLKALFLEFEKSIDEIKLPADGSGVTYPGSFMFDLLARSDITHQKKAIILEVLDKLILYLTTNSASPFQRKGVGLQKFSDLLRVVYSKDNFTMEHRLFIEQCYKVHVAPEDPKKNWKGGGKDGWGKKQETTPINTKTGRVVSYWCFNPGFGMKELYEQGVRSIILTSGTLSPLASFTTELQVPFPIQLENPHIIQGHQVWVGVVNKGPDGFSLNSSFKNRSDPRYIASLGQTILNFSRIVPDGLLVFFPSYPIMLKCKEEWQESGIWGKISTNKPCFVEPRTKDEFQCAMEEFYAKINDPATKGACFMAVTRGKVSEGLDFADYNGRAVIITGLPYPPFKDPRVMLKQQYLDDTKRKNKVGLTGQEWYSLEASRAVNQAIGRVIRHKDDFGAIILCDNRFGAVNFRGKLSTWVRPYMKTYESFGPSQRDLIQFFRNTKALCPQPKMKNSSGQPSVSIKYETPELVPIKANALQGGSSKYVMSSDTKRKLNESRVDESTYTNALSIDSYTKIESKVKPKKSSGDGTLFSALEQRNSVLDFNSVSSVQASSRYESIKQPSKKRKINIVSSQVSLPSQEAIQCGQGVSSKENKVQESSHSTGSSTSGKENESKKMKDIAIYLKEVKMALSKEQYSSFSNAVKTYQKDKDYENVIGNLASLFSPNPDHHTLFRKFSPFLQKEHQPKFSESCELML